MRHAAGGLRRRCLLGAALIGALFGIVAPTRAADHEHGGDSDWLAFPSLIGRTHWDDNGPPPSPYNDWIKADLLYTHTSGSFRVLAESEISNQEAEIERLQFGWELGETTLLWLGRYHQPTSAWNTDHHHGQYLQTSITRPSIERWEDEGGILPQHVAGALLDSRGALTGNSGLVISVGAGAGPVVTNDGLDPVRVIHANHGGHRAAFSARVGFLPDLLGEDAFGLMYAHYDMPVVEATARAQLNADTVKQQVVGAYANVFRSSWRLRSVIYHVDEGNESAAGTRRRRFDAGYAQLEYSAPASLTPYTRLESSSALAGTDFVVLQRDAVDVRRALLGLRWDFHRHQALTLEVAHAATAVTSYHEARLQWSGVLP